MLDPVLEARLREWRKAPAYLLALLQALQFRNSDLGPMRRLDATEWNELLSFSDRTHLTLQLAQLPSDVLPAWVSFRIQENVSDNTRRIERIRALYQEAANAFGRVGAQHIVLKGFSQFPDYVRSPNLRMQSDIDLYCPPNAILSARDALREIGYKERPAERGVPVDHFPALIRDSGWQWRGNMFDPEMPPAIELHFCLWNEQSAQFGIPEVEQFWYRRIERSQDGFQFAALDSIDHLAFCSLHVLRGLFRGEWIIHHVYELAYFLDTHANDQKFWQKWQTTHSDALRSLEAISFCLARIWFGCAISTEVKNQIDGLSVPIQHWFHHFCSSFLELMFTPRRDGVWLNVALLESRDAKISAIFRGLLPTRVPPLRLADQSPSLDRRVVPPKHSLRGLRYFGYVSGRVIFYWCVFFHGVVGGIRWWRSQRKFGGSLRKSLPLHVFGN